MVDRLILEAPRSVSVGGYQGGEYRSGASLELLAHTVLPDRSYAMLDKPASATHMYITTTDNMYLLMVTNPNEADNAKRKYLLISANQNQGRAPGADLVGRDVFPEQLTGIALKIGEPVRLGPDPQTRRPLKSSGAVSAITVAHKGKAVKTGTEQMFPPSRVHDEFMSRIAGGALGDPGATPGHPAGAVPPVPKAPLRLVRGGGGATTQGLPPRPVPLAGQQHFG